MKKSVISLVLVMVMVLTLFAACGNKTSVLSEKEAQKKALESLGLTAKDVTDIHTHIAGGDVPGYSFHITCGDEEYSVLIDAVTGEVVE